MSEPPESKTIATIDEALEKTYFGIYNIQLIIFSGMVLSNVFLESVGVSYVLPVIGCDLNLSHKQQGILGGVCFLGIIVSSHFWGFMADIKGRKRTMRPALLLGFLVTLISSFSFNFIMMAILRFLNGIFISAGSATIFAYLSEFHCQKNRNKAVLCAYFISAFTAVFLPIIAWLLINQEWTIDVTYLPINYKPWRLYLLTCGILGLVCYIIFNYLPESPKYLLGVDKTGEVLDIMKNIHRKNTQRNKNLKDDCFTITIILADVDTPLRKKDTKNSTKSIISIMRLIWDQTASLFLKKHIRKTCLAALIQFIIFFIAHGFYMWSPYIINNTMLYTKQYEEPICLCDILKFTQSSNFSISNSLDDNQEKNICTTKLEISTYKLTIILEAIYALLTLCMIFANNKFNRTFILFVILVISGVFGFLSVIIKIPLVAIYMIVIMLCSGIAQSVVCAIVVDIYPTHIRAMAVCVSLMFGRIGSVSGSYIMGALLETYCELVFYTSSFALIFAGCLGFLLPKAKNNSNNENKSPTEGNEHFSLDNCRK